MGLYDHGRVGRRRTHRINTTFKITTRSQGPIIYEALLPKIKRFQESMKNIASKNQNPLIPEKVIAKQKAQTISKETKVVENNSNNNNKKRSVEPNMGYDIVEDIKKTKESVLLFEMCNLPQQKNKIL